MREILFRGKCIEGDGVIQPGQWVEGNLIHRTLNYGDPIDEYYILYTGEFHYDFYDHAQVDPKTIGQFTGLVDKNGKKIFDGDILAETIFRKEYFGVVEAERWNCGCCHSVFGYRIVSNGNMDLTDYRPHYEVRGNIHDNPDLLEKGE